MPADGGSIVVGVDGSDGSRGALEFAVDEALLRNLSVRAVLVYEPPDLWVIPAGVRVDMHELRQAATQKVLAMVESVADARRRRGEAVPVVRAEVHPGPASPVLERLSREAKLLVVGHRGRGEVATRLIGSVGLNCVVHARCTVVVVRS
jgi:nucleotide-binding universal stress UspA family protein